MPIAGLTLTLNADPILAAEAVKSMIAKPEISVGEIHTRWVAAVLDVPGQRAGKDVHRWIESLDGIDFVDVVYVAFDEEPSAPPARPEPAPLA